MPGSKAMFPSRSFWKEAGWLAMEFVLLFAAFALVFATDAYMTGKPCSEDNATMIFMALYFCFAMRLKGVSL
jgi:hypothetical protein